MPETTPLIKAALNLRVGAGFDVYDNGILHAATAFGKTVVSSAIIAQKKINTLIILESSALIEQWKEALEKFLNINEGLPTYETKTGRVRKRKSLIGTLQGAHDSMTGIIDIAMAGSLCKKGKYHKMMNEYGLVLIDDERVIIRTKLEKPSKIKGLALI